MIKEKKIVILYMFFVFLSNFSMLEQFLSAFLVSLKINITIISILFFIYQFSKFIFEIPTGFISDRFGRKKNALIGFSILIISYFLLLKEDINLFYLSFFLKGLGLTFISGSVESMYIESINSDNLLKYNTIERFVFYSSLALSALIGGFLIRFLNYRGIIIIDLFIMVSLLFLISFFKDSTTNYSENKISIKKCIHILKENSVLIYFLLIDFSTAFSGVGMESLYPAYLKDLGVKIDYIGIFIAFQLILSASFGLFLPKIKNIIESKILLYLFPIIRVLITIPIYLKLLPVFIIPIFFTLQSLFFVSYAPLKYQIFQKNIPDLYRATILSISSQLIACGAIFFYGLSSILGRFLKLPTILLISLFVTLILTSYSCFKLYKKNIID